jgi:hypothetical protein
MTIQIETLDKPENKSENKPKRKPYSVKSPSRGGARKNSGRKKGGTNKVQYTDLLEELHKATGKSFAELIADEVVKAITAGDSRLVKDYLDMVGKKAIADKSETDITSGGNELSCQFVFNGVELNDWKDKQ